MNPRRPPVVSNKLRKSARGQTCTLRLPGVCDHGTETTVLAHARILSKSGLGQKPDDFHAMYACDGCHAEVDGRTNSLVMTPEEVAKEVGRAMVETQRRMYDQGLLRVEGVK